MHKCKKNKAFQIQIKNHKRQKMKNRPQPGLLSYKSHVFLRNVI